MAGLTSHNFLSAAAGIAMAAAVARAFAANRGEGLGNFWVDLTRISLYVLLPLSIVIALVFVALGEPQTLTGHVDMTGIEGAKQTNIALPDRQPGSDQAARHQRRRHLQRQLRRTRTRTPTPSPTSSKSIEMNVLGYACVFAFGIDRHGAQGRRAPWSR